MEALASRAPIAAIRRAWFLLGEGIRGIYKRSTG
jgi:hypothetical protein